MGLLSCPLPCNTAGEKEEDDSYNSSSSYSYSYSYRRRSSSTRSYSSSSSLSSQRSLQSLPSLSSSATAALHLLDPPSSDAVHHQCATTFKGHSSHVFSLVLSGKHLYSGSYDDEIRVWPRNHLAPPPPYPVATVRGAAVKSLAVFGDRLFSAHQDHKIRVWKINNDNNNTAHQKRTYECIATLPTLNDRFLKIFSAKNYVQVRRHKSCTWVHHVDTVSALALSPDGSHLYSASWDRTFKLWRTSDFRCVESVAGAHDDAINAIVLSHDGHVYTGSADRTIKVWKMKKDGAAKKHSLVSTLSRHRSAVNALALVDDGNVLYSGACDRSIIVWERSSSSSSDGGEHMVVAGALRGHTKAILCLTVVDDLLVSGSADKTIRIWRRRLSITETETTSFLEGGGEKRSSSYECLGVLEGHSKPVKCLAAAVDPNSGSGSGSGSGKGRWYLVYSGSLDCDIKVWRVWIPCV